MRMQSAKCEVRSASGERRPSCHLSPVTCHSLAAFTLLEVMIATAIFFTATFAILGVIATTLRNARALQKIEVDAGMLAAQLTLTNRLFEGTESGDFGDLYPDHTWDQENTPITNGLWRVDFVVHRRVGRQAVDTSMSILVFSPDSPAGGFGGGLRP